MKKKEEPSEKKEGVIKRNWNRVPPLIKKAMAVIPIGSVAFLGLQLYLSIRENRVIETSEVPTIVMSDVVDSYNSETYDVTVIMEIAHPGDTLIDPAVVTFKNEKFLFSPEQSTPEEAVFVAKIVVNDKNDKIELMRSCKSHLRDTIKVSLNKKTKTGRHRMHIKSL